MQANSTITNLPVHMAHTHYYDYVDSFPGLKEGPTLDDKHTSNQKILREQLINGQKGLESHLCFRTCFKLSQKRHIEFCLDKKCDGASFLQSSAFLGYAKN